MNSTRRQWLRAAVSSSAAVLASPSLLQSTLAQAAAQKSNTAGNNACNGVLSHALRPLMGSERKPLCEKFANHVLLMVNTASKCGFTPQFEDLEKLHHRYSGSGFQVLGFPSGDFRQELETEEQVAHFCELNYGVTFPMFEKISVTGANAHPLYQQLASTTGNYPNWNFNKYLIDRNGIPVNHYSSGAAPMGNELIGDIEALL